MPVLDWNSYTVGGLGVVIDWGTGTVIVVPPPTIDFVYLHALATSTLFHAAMTAGESTPATVIYQIVDEAGNLLVDEAGNFIIAPADEEAILLHAKETNMLYHAEK